MSSAGEEIRLSWGERRVHAYRLDVIVDGEQRSSINLTASEDDQEFVIPTNRWFPGNASDITACRNMPAM